MMVTTPLRKMRPIKLGMAISPFKVSEISQIAFKPPVAPTKTIGTKTIRYT